MCVCGPFMFEEKKKKKKKKKKKEIERSRIIIRLPVELHFESKSTKIQRFLGKKNCSVHRILHTMIICLATACSLHVSPQQAHNIKMTSYQRRCDVITSHRHWYDVILTLCAHWVLFFRCLGKSVLC